MFGIRNRCMLKLKIAFTFLLVSLEVNAEELSVNRLLNAIRAELPDGWVASYEESYSWLAVSRDKPVLSVSALPNSPGLENAERRPFAFAFRIVELVPVEDYRRFLAENERTREKATRVYQELVDKGVPQKFDSFHPRTREEEAEFAQYEALKGSLHALPDFYFGSISLVWEFNSPNNPTIGIADNQVRDECTKVQEKVVSLLSRYEDAEQAGASNR